MHNFPKLKYSKLKFDSQHLMLSKHKWLFETVECNKKCSLSAALKCKPGKTERMFFYSKPHTTKDDVGEGRSKLYNRILFTKTSIRIRAKRGQRAQGKWGVWKNRTINLFPVKHQMRRSLWRRRKESKEIMDDGATDKNADRSTVTNFNLLLQWRHTIERA